MPPPKIQPTARQHVRWAGERLRGRGTDETVQVHVVFHAGWMSLGINFLVVTVLRQNRDVQKHILHRLAVDAIKCAVTMINIAMIPNDCGRRRDIPPAGYESSPSMS